MAKFLENLVVYRYQRNSLDLFRGELERMKQARTGNDISDFGDELRDDDHGLM